MDTTHLTASLRDNQSDLQSLQAENRQLQSALDAIVDDFEHIQDEHLRERQAYDQELAQLRQQINDKQETIDSILENNVSLRFEMSTYGRLLDVEEKHMNRTEQGQQLQSSGPGFVSSSSSTYTSGPGYTSSSSQPGYTSSSQPGYTQGSTSGLGSSSQPGYTSSSQPGYTPGATSGYASSSQPGNTSTATSGYGSLSSPLQAGLAPTYEASDRALNELGTKKMTVQKTARGSEESYLLSLKLFLFLF